MKNILIAAGTLSLLIILAIYLSKSSVRSEINLPVSENVSDKSIDNRKFLIIGEVWPPFEYYENGQLTGINIEVFKIIFKNLDIDYEVKLYPWARAKMMAENGEADAVVSLSYKKEREKYFLYTESQKEFGRSGKWPQEYLWNSEYVFFCKKLYADKIKFESYKQIKNDGYKVGLIRDYSYTPEFLKSGLGDFTASDIATGFKLLEKGTYDIFPADKTIGKATIAQINLQDKITFIPKPLFKKPYLIPFCKNSNWKNKENLMKRVYIELGNVHRNGIYAEISRKYLKNIR